MKVTGNAQDQLLGVTGENNFVPTLWRPIQISVSVFLLLQAVLSPSLPATPPPDADSSVIARTWENDSNAKRRFKENLLHGSQTVKHWRA